jgi:hypothetical protein
MHASPPAHWPLVPPVVLQVSSAQQSVDELQFKPLQDGPPAQPLFAVHFCPAQDCGRQQADGSVMVPQLCPVGQAGHVTRAPQLLVGEPHRPLLQATPSSKQHVKFGVHSPPLAHAPPFAPHATVWLQPLSKLPQLLPLHTGCGRQQVPPLQRPPHAPQSTCWPQLFCAKPQFFPTHAVTLSGTQPPQVLLTHLPEPGHPAHVIGLPQLSVVAPHRPSHHCGFGRHSQAWVVALHCLPSPHSLGHRTVRPQSSSVTPQWSTQTSRDTQASPAPSDPPSAVTAGSSPVAVSTATSTPPSSRGVPSVIPRRLPHA